MIISGYILHLPSPQDAEKSLEICRNAAEGTVWQAKTEATYALITVSRKTKISEEEFGLEGYPQEGSLFHKVCFALTNAYPDMKYWGECDVRISEREYMKIYAEYPYESVYLRFRSQEASPGKRALRRQYWKKEAENPEHWYMDFDNYMSRED